MIVEKGRIPYHYLSRDKCIKKDASWCKRKEKFQKHAIRSAAQSWYSNCSGSSTLFLNVESSSIAAPSTLPKEDPFAWTYIYWDEIHFYFVREKNMRLHPFNKQFGGIQTYFIPGRLDKNTRLACTGRLDKNTPSIFIYFAY